MARNEARSNGRLGKTNPLLLLVAAFVFVVTVLIGGVATDAIVVCVVVVAGVIAVCAVVARWNFYGIADSCMAIDASRIGGTNPCAGVSCGGRP